MSTTTRQKHIGRNIGRIREMRNMKQEALAQAIGVSQQTISTIENSEIVDDDKLVEIAKALGVNPEAIKNFSEEGVINYFNTFNDSALSHSTGAFSNSCTFNPLDKLVEAYEEIQKVYKEKEELYERLIEELKMKKL